MLAEKSLHSAQEALHKHAQDVLLIQSKSLCAQNLQQAKNDFASYLQQKAKIAWIKHGDENTSYFHNSIKQRCSYNKINHLHIDDNLMSDPFKIQQGFIAFYTNLLCRDMVNRRKVNMDVIHSSPILSTKMRNQLSLKFSPEEIKLAI